MGSSTLPKLVWLASYPRSGNTLLRTILFQCFGLSSGSVYPKDLGQVGGIQTLVGHVEAKSGRMDFGDQAFGLVKTHGSPQTSDPAIYVLRDGRDAAVSLFHFLNEAVPILDIVEGKTRFGTWAQHIATWSPKVRSGTLLVRYEDMTDRLEDVVQSISAFLEIIPQSRSIPSREEMAKQDGRWIKSSTQRGAPIRGAALDRFMELNGQAMRDWGLD